MGQKEIYQILQELGGTAFPKDIKKLAYEKYPDASLHDYIYHLLKKLNNWGLVKKNPDGSWTILEEYVD